MTAKAVKIIAKRRIKRKTRKNTENQRNSSQKIHEDSRSKKNKVILPEDLLNKAKNKISDKPNNSQFLESIEIYDIDDDINFRYLINCGKITKDNYKYIYSELR